jgi:hypothetical protein
VNTRKGKERMKRKRKQVVEVHTKRRNSKNINGEREIDHPRLEFTHTINERSGEKKVRKKVKRKHINLNMKSITQHHH